MASKLPAHGRINKGLVTFKNQRTKHSFKNSPCNTSYAVVRLCRILTFCYPFCTNLDFWLWKVFVQGVSVNSCKSLIESYAWQHFWLPYRDFTWKKWKSILQILPRSFATFPPASVPSGWAWSSFPLFFLNFISPRCITTAVTFQIFHLCISIRELWNICS